MGDFDIDPNYPDAVKNWFRDFAALDDDDQQEVIDQLGLNSEGGRRRRKSKKAGRRKTKKTRRGGSKLSPLPLGGRRRKTRKH